MHRVRPPRDVAAEGGELLGLKLQLVCREGEQQYSLSGMRGSSGFGGSLASSWLSGVYSNACVRLQSAAVVHNYAETRVFLQSYLLKYASIFMDCPELVLELMRIV